jgi:hypothetical protein
MGKKGKYRDQQPQRNESLTLGERDISSIKREIGISVSVPYERTISDK